MIASHATKEMNPTPTILIITVTVVTMTRKCTPDHPNLRVLNSLHNMAYCKWILVNCHIKHIIFTSIVVVILFHLIIVGCNYHILFMPEMIKLHFENFLVTYLKSTNYFNLVSYCISRKLISLSHLSMLTP